MHRFPTRKRNKYNAKKTVVDDIAFDSRKEADRYKELKLLKKSGHVVFFLRQVPFHFPGGKWTCDFLVFWENGACTVEDVKGHRTAEYKRIKKIVEAHYPITVTEK